MKQMTKLMTKKRPSIFILILSDINLGLFLFLFLGFTLICIVSLIDEEPLFGLGIVLLLLAFLFFLLLIRRMKILNSLFKKGVYVEGKVVDVSLSLYSKTYRNPQFRVFFTYWYHQVEYRGSTHMNLPNVNYETVNLLINPSKPSQWYCIDKLNQVNQTISLIKSLFSRNN